PAERAAMIRNGWQPYTWYPGGWKNGGPGYSFARLGPIGQTFAFAADFAEATHQGDIDPRDKAGWDEVAAGGVAAISQFTVNATYLKGFADVVNVTSDPERYGAK